MHFILGDNESDAPTEVAEEGTPVAKSERSHLVVWQVGLAPNNKIKTQF